MNVIKLLTMLLNAIISVLLGLLLNCGPCITLSAYKVAGLKKAHFYGSAFWYCQQDIFIEACSAYAGS